MTWSLIFSVGEINERARLMVSGSPITRGRESECSRGLDHARATSSGPMPEISPIVSAIFEGMDFTRWIESEGGLGSKLKMRIKIKINT
jgi:hypothetical protein